VLLTAYACITAAVWENTALQVLCIAAMLLRCALVYGLASLVIFPRLYQTRLLLLLASAATFFLSCALSSGLQSWLADTLNPAMPPSFGQMMLHEFFLCILLFAFAGQAYRRKLLRNDLKTSSEKEIALLVSELGFLKNQFNSHITFNFLNYCYNRIHKESSETAEAIEIFSKMLRYSLNNKADELVPLSEEVNHIQDFLKLQKLLNPELRVEFMENCQTGNSFYIAPGVLLIFMENALNSAYLHAYEDTVRIELSLTGDLLNLKVVNKRMMQRNVEILNIGQFHLKQQLELFYKDRYLLNVNNDGTCNLKLAIR
jgi:hypothetical protein